MKIEKYFDNQYDAIWMRDVCFYDQYTKILKTLNKKKESSEDHTYIDKNIKKITEKKKVLRLKYIRKPFALEAFDEIDLP